MINKYTNKQRGLLAVIMAMVMVFAGAAFVAAEVDAIEAPEVVEVATSEEFSKNITDGKPIKLIANIEISGYYTIKADLDLNGYTITANDTKIQNALLQLDYGKTIVVSGMDDDGNKGKIIVNSNYKRILNGQKDGNVTITDASLSGGLFYNVSTGGAAFEIQNTDFTAEDNATGSGVYVNIKSGALSITNCTFKGEYTQGEVNIDRFSDKTNSSSVSIDSELDLLCIQLTGGNDLANITITGDVKTTNFIVADYKNMGTPIINGNIPGETIIIQKHNSESGNVFKVATDFEISENQSFIINKNAVMSVEGSFTNNGTVVNNSIINNLGTVINNGLFTNNGTINNGVPVMEVTGSTGSFVNNGSFTNGQNAEFNNNEGSTFTNDGTATLENGSEFVNDGAYVGNTLLAETGAIITGDNQDQVGTLTGSTDDSLNLKGTLEGDMDITKNVYLSDNLVIAEGVTMKITSKGSLELMGYALTVLGTLEIENNGKITAVGGGRILIGTTGTITNDGMIGANSNVEIGVAPASDGEYTPQGTVTVNNIIGAEFSLKKEVVGTTITYTLVVGGDISKKGTSYAFSINGAYIEDMDIGIDGTATLAGVTVLKGGSLVIGSKAVVTITDEIELSNGVTLTVDGVLVAGNVHMLNGSTAVVNGNVNGVDFCAKTGDYPTYNNEERNDPESDAVGLTESMITLDEITGFTITVTSKTYVVEDDGTETSMTLQALNITGEASFIKDVTAGGTIAVTKDVYIPVGSKVVLSEGMSVGEESGKFIVQGTLQTLDDDNIVYEGAAYSVKVPKEPSGNYIVYYYTNFDDAFAAIETAEYKTVTISGDYEFVKDYTIAAGQTIVFGSSVGVEYTIAADATITVEADGTFGTNFVKADAANSIPAGIQGILIVKEEGTCTPVADSYEVKSVSEDGTITYSGAAIAIENAKEGDVIDIVNAVVFTDDMTIPAGVTVEIASTGSITAEKGLTVVGKIVNEGEIIVEGDFNVSGVVENENDVTVTTSGVSDKNTATITGTYTGELVVEDGIINAANFSDEGVNTYTNVADAVAKVAEMDVPAIITVTGKFTESSDVVLTEGQTLTINGEVVLKSIRLVAGSTLTVGTDGILTADVIAAVGTEETTGALSDAVVDVTKINDISGWTVNYNEAKATYTMVMPAYTSGDVVIEAGSVNYKDANSSFGVAGSNPVVYKTMKVASGATLVVANNITDTEGDKKYFVNEGTIIVSDNENFTNVLLGGTVNVDLGKTLTLTASQIVGEVVLATEEGKTPASVAISRQVLIGSTPKTLGAAGSIVGKVTFATANDYVVVFEGSTFNNTDDSVETLSTAYTINDIAFATVYTTVQNVDITVINEIVAGLKDLNVPDVLADGEITTGSGWTRDYSNDIVWKSGSTSVNSAKVGKYDTVNAKIDYKSVSFIVAVGPGLQVYIDDVEYSTMIEDGKVTETIGTHTITAYIEKGYEGTPAITLNGVAVTDGKLVLTSDMLGKENKLVVTGATVMQDQPVVIQPSDSEKDGMELTDILLIVLVVLIVIMAIIVALRMMRS